MHDSSLNPIMKSQITPHFSLDGSVGARCESAPATGAGCCTTLLLKKKNEITNRAPLSLSLALQLVVSQLLPLPVRAAAEQRPELLPLLVGDLLGEGHPVGHPQVTPRVLQLGRKSNAVGRQ